MLNILCPIHILCSIILPSMIYSDMFFRRDGSLVSLSSLLNNHSEVFNAFKGSNEDIGVFFSMMEQWLLSPLSQRLMFDEGPYIVLNCSSIKYSNVLTGKMLSVPRMVVDFVPFGYDVEKLYVRLYETYDYVDIFVLYESTRTQSAISKPLYFSKLKLNKRMRKWLDKIVYLNSSDVDIQSHISQTLGEIESKRNGKRVNNNRLWALELSMRTTMVRKFKELQGNALKDSVMQSNRSVYGIQNDGDEIISGKVLKHLKHCELKSEVTGIYTPSFVFKRNFHFMERTSDLACVVDASLTKDANEVLSRFLWRPGPYLWPLATILATGSTMQEKTFVRGQLDSRLYCQHHMGIGAAVHMSSVLDPVEVWLKQCGVIELDCQGALSPAFIQKCRSRSVSPKDILSTALQLVCDHRFKNYVNILSLPAEARAVLTEAVPWVVRMNPDSFPFLLPGNGTAAAGDGKRANIMRKIAQTSGEDLCRGSK